SQYRGGDNSMTRVVPWSSAEDSTNKGSTKSLPPLIPAGGASTMRGTSRRAVLPREAVSSWSRHFVRQLVLADALCAVLAITVGWAVRSGFPTDVYMLAYVEWAIILTVAWLACLQTVGAYEVRRISTGAREYQRVLRGSINLAGAVAITGYITGVLLA